MTDVNLSVLIKDSARAQWLKTTVKPALCDNCVTDRLLTTIFAVFLAAMALTQGVVRGADADRSVSTTSLMDDGTLVRVPVKVFGKTLYFMVDTGFTKSAIDRRYENELGEALDTRDAASPLGAINDVQLFAAPKMSVCGKALDLQEVLCVDLKMPRLISGQPCDGVLGMDVLQHWVVTFDFDRKIFTLSGAASQDVRTNFIAVPLRPVEPNGFVASLVIDRSASFDFMVDTGDSSSLSLNVSAWDRICSMEKARQLSTTLGGMNEKVRQSKIMVLKDAALEKLAYTNLHATLIPNPADPCHLGLAFFRRHLAVFDFPNHVLYLKPGKRFSLADNEDESGLHLLRQDGATFVYSVDHGSPAAAQGVRPQDVIAEINGQESSSLTMKAIRRLLQSGEGTPIDLQIKRGPESLPIKFVLKGIE